MKEEQAVLDFFANAVNLPLGLAVAEQMDRLRAQMNNRLWHGLLERLGKMFEEYAIAWRAEITEDKNATDVLVGLHCAPYEDQSLYLSPMMEQQHLGGQWRVYYGLMWNTKPSPDQLGLKEVGNLKLALQKAGFKSNENFLAWQWTPFYPRRREFLLRYSQHPERILGELEDSLKKMLVEHRMAIIQANAALKATPDSLAVSLDQLRRKHVD